MHELTGSRLQQTQYLQSIFVYTLKSAQIATARYVEELLSRPRNADPKRLLKYGRKVYSQNDEDGILQEIFRRIGTTGRSFVELGVDKGVECNTAKLLVEGWRGTWIEGSQEKTNFIAANFADFIKEGRLRLVTAMISAENINDHVSCGPDPELDLLSIDIDGNDYWVWKALEAVRPRVVVIEYNAILPPPMSLVVPYDTNRVWDGSNYYGASLEALVRLGKDKGYRLVGCCLMGVNAFFVREDLCGDHFFEPATAEEHFEPARHFHYPGGSHWARPGRYVQV